MKKLLSISIAALIVAGTATPAFAHSSHHAETSRYSVCTVRSCAQTDVHTHNGKTYTAHHNRDGHSYHRDGHSYHRTEKGHH